MITVVTLIKNQIMIKWLQGGPGLPEALAKDPISKKIKQVHVANNGSQIHDLVSKYTPDVVIFEANMVPNAIESVAKLVVARRSRVVVLIQSPDGNNDNIELIKSRNQKLIDFCIDNGVYDILVGKITPDAIKRSVLDGLARGDVAHLSSGDRRDVPTVTSTIKEAQKNEQTAAPVVKSYVPGGTGNKQIIAVFSMKSVGKTSVTVNTAIAMAQMGLKVAVIDINNVTPDAGAYMHIKRGTAGIEKYFTGIVNIAGIGQLIQKKFDVDVIPMGSMGELTAVPIQPKQLDDLVNYLKEEAGYDVIFIDLSPVLDTPANRMVIKKSDQVILVVNQMPATVENMYSQIIKINNLCNKSSNDIKLVVNNYQDTNIDLNKIKAFLGADVIGAIPLDYAGFVESAKTKTPYVIAHPKKIKPFVDIAKQVLGKPTEESSKEGLFDRLKRLVTKK